MARGGLVLTLLAALTLIQLGALDCCPPDAHARASGRVLAHDHASNCTLPTGCHCAHALGGAPLWLPLHGVAFASPDEGRCTRPIPLFLWRTPPG